MCINTNELSISFFDLKILISDKEVIMPTFKGHCVGNKIIYLFIQQIFVKHLDEQGTVLVIGGTTEN